MIEILYTSVHLTTKSLRQILIILTVLLCLMTGPALAQGIAIQVNGREVAGQASPKMIQGRVYVPLRLVADALEIDINWDENTRTVIVGKQEGQLSPNPSPNEIRLIVNGKVIETEEPPFLDKGSTLVPVRVVAEALGARVNWNSTASIVEIHSLPKREPGPAPFRIVSPSGPEPDYPFFLLVPEDWQELTTEDAGIFRYKTKDNLTLEINSWTWSTPMLRPVTSYTFLGRDYFLGKPVPYQDQYPLFLGGKLAYRYRYMIATGMIIETYEIMDGEGGLTLTFRGWPGTFPKYQDTIELMVSTLQLPEEDSGAWSKILLARDYLNFSSSLRFRMNSLPDYTRLNPEELNVAAFLAYWEPLQQWLNQQQVPEILRNYYEKVWKYSEGIISHSRLHMDPLTTPKKLEESAWQVQKLFLAFSEENDRITEEIFSNYAILEETDFGSFREYSWPSGYFDSYGNSFVYSLVLPEKWKEQRQGNHLKIVDETGQYSFTFLLDTENPGSPEDYSRLIWEQLEEKEILFSYEGVFWWNPGEVISYRDRINGSPVTCFLFYFPSGIAEGHNAVLLTMPENTDPRLEELLWIVTDSLQINTISFRNS
ncbi:MAG TPA: copper amine oxidase N-terminal domain-containing protein [Clostridia bacterium]|nr:copper amine oxidase N-terminal domain-containing protein [Clostridia bacterium]